MIERKKGTTRESENEEGEEEEEEEEEEKLMNTPACAFFMLWARTASYGKATFALLRVVVQVVVSKQIIHTPNGRIRPAGLCFHIEHPQKHACCLLAKTWQESQTYETRDEKKHRKAVSSGPSTCSCRRASALAASEQLSAEELSSCQLWLGQKATLLKIAARNN